MKAALVTRLDASLRSCMAIPAMQTPLFARFTLMSFEPSAVPTDGAAAPAFHPDNVPAELKTLPRWCVWRRIQRDGGKPAKMPYQPNGKPAKSNDAATWSTWEAALAAYQVGKYDGLGLFMAGNLTGVDLDHCIDASGATPAATEILERFAGTYIEVSPSGMGYRIFCYGQPGRSGKNGGAVKWVEVYAEPSWRFLTVTGNVINPVMVTAQQDALDWLHTTYFSQPDTRKPETPTRVHPSLESDDVLLTKARQASNGAAFDALWRGDTSGHGGDASSADMALCGLLAFWTGGDAGAVDRLFRQSGLMRDKWDTRRGDTTYGAATVATAVANCKEVYSRRKPASGKGKHGSGADTASGREPGIDDEPATTTPEPDSDATPPRERKWLSGTELLGMEFPEPIWLLPDILPEVGAFMLSGKPKAGKSWFVLQLAMAAVQGGRFLDRDIPVGGCLYLALEDNFRRLKERMLKLQPDALDHKADFSALAYRVVAPTVADGLPGELRRAIGGASRKIRLAIVDTLQKARGPSGTQGTQYGLDYDVLSKLKAVADEMGICLLVVHHLRKADSEDVHDCVSGTQGIAGAADGSLILVRQRGGDTATLHVTGRDMPEAELGLKFDGCCWTFAGSAEEVKASAEQNELMNALKEYGSEGATTTDLAKETGKKVPTLRFLLRKLADAGRVRVRKTKPPRYAVCDGPAAALVDCAKCHGSGNVGYGKANGRCFECNGSGKVTAENADSYRRRDEHGMEEALSDADATDTPSRVNLNDEREREREEEESAKSTYATYATYAANATYATYAPEESDVSGQDSGQDGGNVSDVSSVSLKEADHLRTGKVDAAYVPASCVSDVSDVSEVSGTWEEF